MTSAIWKKKSAKNMAQWFQFWLTIEYTEAFGENGNVFAHMWSQTSSVQVAAPFHNRRRNLDSPHHYREQAAVKTVGFFVRICAERGRGGFVSQKVMATLLWDELGLIHIDIIFKREQSILNTLRKYWTGSTSTWTNKKRIRSRKVFVHRKNANCTRGCSLRRNLLN